MSVFDDSVLEELELDESLDEEEEDDEEGMTEALTSDMAVHEPSGLTEVAKAADGVTEVELDKKDEQKCAGRSRRREQGGLSGLLGLRKLHRYGGHRHSGPHSGHAG